MSEQARMIDEAKKLILAAADRYVGEPSYCRGYPYCYDDGETTETCEHCELTAAVVRLRDPSSHRVISGGSNGTP